MVGRSHFMFSKMDNCREALDLSQEESNVDNTIYTKDNEIRFDINVLENNKNSCNVVTNEMENNMEDNIARNEEEVSCRRNNITTLESYQDEENERGTRRLLCLDDPSIRSIVPVKTSHTKLQELHEVPVKSGTSYTKLQEVHEVPVKTSHTKLQEVHEVPVKSGTSYTKLQEVHEVPVKSGTSYTKSQEVHEVPVKSSTSNTKIHEVPVKRGHISRKEDGKEIPKECEASCTRLNQTRARENDGVHYAIHSGNSKKAESISQLLSSPSNFKVLSAQEEFVGNLIKPGKSNEKKCPSCKCNYSVAFVKKCPMCHPVKIIKNRPGNNANEKLNLFASLPKEFFLHQSDEQGHGIGIFSVMNMKKGTVFGPLEGPRVSAKDLRLDYSDLCRVWPCVDRTLLDIDAQEFIITNESYRCNWLQFLRVCQPGERGNVVMLLHDNDIYFMAETNLKSGEELVLVALDPRYDEHLASTHCLVCQVDFPHALANNIHRLFYHKWLYSRQFEKNGLRLTSKMSSTKKSPEYPQPVSCTTCAATYSTGHKVVEHMQTVHGQSIKWMCNYCAGLEFVTLLDLLQHLAEKHSQPVDAHFYPCGECCVIYRTMHSFVQHNKNKHSNKLKPKPLEKEVFPCPTCGKVMSRKGTLQRHMKIHAGEMACACEHCGKTFHSPSNLKVHLLTHSGVKPFGCQVLGCEAAYTTKQCLQVHYRKVHGYADANMPSIKRSVPFTFEDYSQPGPEGTTVFSQNRGRGKSKMTAKDKLHDSDQKTDSIMPNKKNGISEPGKTLKLQSNGSEIDIDSLVCSPGEIRKTGMRQGATVIMGHPQVGNMHQGETQRGGLPILEAGVPREQQLHIAREGSDVRQPYLCRDMTIVRGDLPSPMDQTQMARERTITSPIGHQVAAAHLPPQTSISHRAPDRFSYTQSHQANSTGPQPTSSHPSVPQPSRPHPSGPHPSGPPLGGHFPGGAHMGLLMGAHVASYVGAHMGGPPALGGAPTGAGQWTQL